jgi:hypothetical protein
MKSLFEPGVKDMEIIIGDWNEHSTRVEVFKLVVMTVTGKPQSINMKALDRLQKKLVKVESQLAQMAGRTTAPTPQSTDTKIKKSTCKTQ